MHILTGNEDVHLQEWGCDSPGMQILTRKGDVPNRECMLSPGMHALHRDAHSLYRVIKESRLHEEESKQSIINHRSH